MDLVLPVLASVGFGCLYGLTVGYHGGPGALAGTVIGLVYLAAFVLPTRLFAYTDRDVAPAVLSQLGRRWVLATCLTVVAGAVAAWLTPWDRALQLAEELYMYSLVAIVVFHGLAGMYASHVVYLQATRQYNSNQLLALTMLLVLLLVMLMMYFLAFDFAASRETYVYVRDMLLVTLTLVGFGWHGFRIAHH